jgi:hypothetical protein
MVVEHGNGPELRLWREPNAKEVLMVRLHAATGDAVVHLDEAGEAWTVMLSL